MDKKVRSFIDEELYPMIVTPIEKHIKPNMTIQEKFIAKQDVFLEIKELVNGAKIFTELSVEEIIETIKNIMEKRKELHEGSSLQYELVTNILDEIMKQDKEEEKSI